MKYDFNIRQLNFSEGRSALDLSYIDIRNAHRDAFLENGIPQEAWTIYIVNESGGLSDALKEARWDGFLSAGRFEIGGFLNAFGIGVSELVHLRLALIDPEGLGLVDLARWWRVVIGGTIDRGAIDAVYGTIDPYLLDFGSTQVFGGSEGPDFLNQRSDVPATIVGYGGDDFIYGSDLGDRIHGGDGRDYLEGLGGNDTIYGGKGDDTLSGGGGDDTLVGEGGSDTYLLRSDNHGRTIIDDDTGALKLDGAKFGGVAHNDAGDGLLHIQGYTAQMVGADLRLTLDSNPANELLLKNFTDGDYGIVTTADQSQLVEHGSMSAHAMPGYSTWQSFTAGKTGRLIEINAGFFSGYFATPLHGQGRLLVREGSGVGGVVLSDSIVTVDAPASGARSFSHWVVDVPVTAGAQYTFQFIPLSGVNNPYGVALGINPYAGGSLGITDPGGVYDTEFDWVFRTYVVEPPPEGAGGAGGGGPPPPFIGDSQDDTLVGGVAGDRIDGRGGNDSLSGGGGADTLIGGSGNDTIDGGVGLNTLDYFSAPAAVSVNATTGIASDGTGGTDRFSNIQDIVGSRFNDTLTGGSTTANLAGGAGDDSYVVNSASTVVVESTGGGTDAVTTGLGAFTLPANVENLLHTGSNNFTGTGNELGNRITGSTGNDTLDGGAGADTLTGDAGNDVYVVDSSGDLVVEASSRGGLDTVKTTLGSYTLGTNVENLTFVGSGGFSGTGNSLTNVVTGAAGADTLNGDTGNDTLIGGGGADLVTGGVGADRFVFAPGDIAIGATRDRIGDFSDAQNDRIDLSLIDANSGLAGDQAFSFIGTAAFGARAGELRVATNGSGLTLSGDTNGDGVADFSIELLSVSTVFARDFVL